MLTFPELSGCTAPKACYSSENDLEELSAEELHIDDGDNYIIKGEELSLGSGGLTASPEGRHERGPRRDRNAARTERIAEMEHCRQREARRKTGFCWKMK